MICILLYIEALHQWAVVSYYFILQVWEGGINLPLLCTFYDAPWRSSLSH